MEWVNIGRRGGVGGKRDAFYLPSTGEDHPEEWPLRGGDVVKGVAKGWAPVVAALAIVGLGMAVTWRNYNIASDPEPAIARTGTDPVMTGAIKPRRD